MELWQCEVGDRGSYEEGVGDVEEGSVGGDGEGGLAVAVGMREEEERFGDDSAVGTGPGEEKFVGVWRGVELCHENRNCGSTEMIDEMSIGKMLRKKGSIQNQIANTSETGRSKLEVDKCVAQGLRIAVYMYFNDPTRNSLTSW